MSIPLASTDVTVRFLTATERSCFIASTMQQNLVGLNVLVYGGYAMAGVSVLLMLLTWKNSSTDLFRIASGFEMDTSVWTHSIPSPLNVVLLLQFLVTTSMMNLDYPLHYVASMNSFRWAMFSFNPSWLVNAVNKY